jgi:ABC-2 type transport system permease protein
MRNIWTIAKREYNNYFSSPLAYAVAFAILFMLGLYFSLIFYYTAEQAMMMGGQAPESTQFNWLFVFLMIFLSPALTMRLISEEARMGTLELMLTAPVRDFELVAGKWLGSLLFVLSIAAVTLIYPLVINMFVDPYIDWWVVLSSYLGLILVCSALLALGTGISAVFTNQFAAFFVTLGLFFFLWFMVSLPASILPQGGEVFNYLSINRHFSDPQAMNNGTINLGDLVYYLSLTALGLFVGSTAVEIRRWN